MVRFDALTPALSHWEREKNKSKKPRTFRYGVLSD